MITIPRSEIKDFESKNQFLVEMFLTQYMTHVVDYFGKNQEFLVPKERLEYIRQVFEKELAIQPKLGLIIEESR